MVENIGVPIDGTSLRKYADEAQTGVKPRKPK